MDVETEVIDCFVIDRVVSGTETFSEPAASLLFDVGLVRNYRNADNLEIAILVFGRDGLVDEIAYTRAGEDVVVPVGIEGQS